uniref:Uncharacterized protein n=1 Tax=Mastacembelus armatus TaxID=205130 RepID=A0A3Q3MZ53_9TELE
IQRTTGITKHFYCGVTLGQYTPNTEHNQTHDIMQCCVGEECLCDCGFAGTELDDVKKLLKGRSSSVSPTRSSTASLTLPVPKKANVEAKTVSVASQSGRPSGQYDTLDAALPSFTWSTSTLPSSSAAVVAGNTSSYTYQASTNNMSGGMSPLGHTSPSSLSGETNRHLYVTCSLQVKLFTSVCIFVFTGYGVQKNVSNGGGIISSGVSTTTRSQTDDAYQKDYKFMISEKENVPAKRDAEMLILAKDSGKQFTSSTGSLSGDSVKKEKLISSYSETVPLKTEIGNSYCEWA